MKRYRYNVMNDVDVLSLEGEVIDRRRKVWIIEVEDKDARFINEAMENFWKAQGLLESLVMEVYE